MFMVGFDIDTRAYYTSVTSIIAIPTGMKVFNWMATAWSGIGFLSSAMLWVYGFLFHFSFGGFTGLILANIIIDVVLHDSYFVVSHFHYVLSLGAVYTIYAAFFNYWIIFSSYYWFYDFLGRIHFIAFFISSNLVFFSMHSLGLYGFPRRIFDYYIYFFKFNWLNAFGIVGIIISFFIFCFNIMISSSRYSFLFILSFINTASFNTALLSDNLIFTCGLFSFILSSLRFNWIVSVLFFLLFFFFIKGAFGSILFCSLFFILFSLVYVLFLYIAPLFYYFSLV